MAGIGTIGVIGGFTATIVKAIMKWYKTKITDRFDRIEQRLDEVESKRDEYEREVRNSKKERELLMRGELACLKGLYAITENDLITNSIKEIEEYMMEKSHD